tara:strand:+ start:3581 stop:4657 length:1077 start_codon:yes stop_codon:yes gene_type:complete
MAVTNGWGQGAVNNTIDWGKGKTTATNNWGAIYDSSASGDTSLGTAAAQSLLLDVYGDNAFLAVSFRKLRTDYTGFCARIRRVGTAGSTGTADDQADLAFNSNGYVSLDSPITAVTEGVLSSTLGEFCAASGYSNPDSMPSADTVEIEKFYNQAEDTTIPSLNQQTTSQFDELVLNGVLETITIGGDEFIACRNTFRQDYKAELNPAAYIGASQPFTIFTITNVKDPGGGFTVEGVSVTPNKFANNALIRYDETSDEFSLVNESGNVTILSSTNTFATDTPYVFTTLLQNSPSTTAYYVNNVLQASRTDFTKDETRMFRYDQSNKTSGPEFMEAIIFKSSEEDNISAINDNIISFYNI